MCGPVLGHEERSETGWATARMSFCFEDECQKAFYAEARAMVRLVNAAMADAMERGTGNAS